MNPLENEFPSLFFENEKRTCFDFGIDAGWIPLVRELCQELVKEDIKILQVKEKFGALRVYISGGTRETFDLIYKYEDKSTSICDQCGAPGKLAVSGGWLVTRCKKHK